MIKGLRQYPSTEPPHRQLDVEIHDLMIKGLRLNNERFSLGIFTER